jgi:putative ABC transport system permease protein
MFNNLLELMLLYVPLVIGVALTFSVSKYPDMSVDGVFVLGAAIASVCSRGDFPVMSLLLAPLCGAAAGMLTTTVHFRFGINRVLSGVIVLLALYSINLFVIGGANFNFLTHPTVFSAFKLSSSAQRISVLLILALFCVVAVGFLLNTVFGLRLRAAGDNPAGFPELLRFPSLYKSAGVIIGSALIATSGALVAQSQGFADVNMGFGILITSLAWLSLGFAVLAPRTPILLAISAIVGMVVFNAILQSILRFGISPFAVKIVTAGALLLALRFSPRSKKLMDQVFS